MWLLCDWGRFPFISTDRPDRSRRKENFTFDKKLSSQSNQILNRMHEGDNFSAKTRGKSLFHFQTDWSDKGPAGQFWQMESALRCTAVADEAHEMEMVDVK